MTSTLLHYPITRHATCALFPSDALYAFRPPDAEPASFDELAPVAELPPDIELPPGTELAPDTELAPVTEPSPCPPLLRPHAEPSPGAKNAETADNAAHSTISEEAPLSEDEVMVASKSAPLADKVPPFETADLSPCLLLGTEVELTSQPVPAARSLPNLVVAPSIPEVKAHGSPAPMAFLPSASGFQPSLPPAPAPRFPAPMAFLPSASGYQPLPPPASVLCSPAPMALLTPASAYQPSLPPASAYQPSLPPASAYQPSLPPASAYRHQPISPPGKVNIVAILKKRELDSKK